MLIRSAIAILYAN